MQCSAKGKTDTKGNEGLRLLPYFDILGKGTIGWGHLILPGENFKGGIDEGQADTIFEWDMQKAERIVSREVTVPMDQGEFDALCDAVFNMGDFLQSSTLLSLLNAGDAEGARLQLERWDHAGGKANAALHARRVQEMALWAQGVNG